MVEMGCFGWRSPRKFLKFLSKTMYKIYDFLINFTEIFLFSDLFLGLATMYNTSKKSAGGGGY